MVKHTYKVRWIDEFLFSHEDTIDADMVTVHDSGGATFSELLDINEDGQDFEDDTMIAHYKSVVFIRRVK
jgi:hypothetical protein